MRDPKHKELEQKVLEFVKAQPGYDKLKHEHIEATCEDKKTYMVIYGDDSFTGMAGLGSTIDEAFEDFKRSWEELKGFEWVEKNRAAGNN